MNLEQIRLTQYSHGAGCGCKISPKNLEEILQGSLAFPDNERLLVGNHTKDDAAVYDLGNNQCLISTTDFFMPIVDDAFDFGRIAAANAISDVYAMGGTPILAIAILGWPIDTLPNELAQRMIDGARHICNEAGISLAGGHSIDSKEPIFGLAVNGLVDKQNIKKNSGAKPGDTLYITKKIGIGILTTAEKKQLLLKEDEGIACAHMVRLNKLGQELGKLKGVNALTDITGFGMLGHLLEMVNGSGFGAEIKFSSVPLISGNIEYYIGKGAVPGGTNRNWMSYGDNVSISSDLDKTVVKGILSDPQTSGGLLISVNPESINLVESLLIQHGLDEYVSGVGRITNEHPGRVQVN